jgi:hypothetical protein
MKHHAKPQPLHRPSDAPPLIIGLAGKKGSGKDTVANHWVSEGGFISMSFARPMKASAAAALGCTVEQLEAAKNDPNAKITFTAPRIGRAVSGWGQPVVSQITVREYLQLFGTEAHRDIPEFGVSVWTDMMVANIQAEVKRSGHKLFVIPDARFENEQRTIKAMGGYIIVVNRPGTDQEDAHASEVVEHGVTDFYIENAGTMADLYDYADSILTHVKEQRRPAATGLSG